MGNNYARNKRFLIAVKETSGCAEPGCKEDSPSRLQFDHEVDKSEKRFDLAHCSNRALKTVIAEVMKCSVRCAYHHELRHYKRSLEQNP